jgi:hypothetical protein
MLLQPLAEARSIPGSKESSDEEEQRMQHQVRKGLLVSIFVRPELGSGVRYELKPGRLRESTTQTDGFLLQRGMGSDEENRLKNATIPTYNFR